MPADRRRTPKARVTDGMPTDGVLADVAARAADDSGGVPADFLADFLAVLCSAVAAGEPIPPATLRRYRAAGDRAARQGVALRALLDLYLSAAWRLWRHLPAVAAARAEPDAVVAAGEVMLHATDDVVAALAEGFQLARRALVRSQESGRREFIDDLLTGASDVVSLLHRAEGFGLDLSGPHAVITARAERDFDDGAPLIAALERSIQGIKGDAQNLLATKDGRLVVVFASPDGAATSHVIDRIAATLGAQRSGRTSVGTWQLGVGRRGVGADGVVTSYRESLDALELAGLLGHVEQVVYARDLLVYRVLLRDRAVLVDLVEDTFGPLRAARGGAAPLLETLGRYFDSGSNSAATARILHLSVRAVTYRLERVRELTGLDPDRPADRFPLHVAVAGARLLDWPSPR